MSSLARSTLIFSFVGEAYGALRLHPDGLGVGAEHRHAHACGAHTHVGRVHYLARLVEHLHLFLGVAVVGEHVDVGDDVAGELCHEFLHGGLFAAGDFSILVFKLLHCGGSCAAGSLICGHVHPADGTEVVDGFQGHHHLDCGAVGVADYAARGVESIVAVDFRHHQRNVGIHAEGAGVVDHQRAVFRYCLGEFARGGCSGRGECYVDAAEVVVVAEFLHGVFLAAEGIGFPRAAAGTEKREVVDGEIGLVEHSE